MSSIKYLTFYVLIAVSVLVNAAPGGGGLPYVTHEGRVKFLVGLDYNHEWADFGGKAEQGETVAQTAAREFSEETCNVFGGGNRAASLQFFHQHNRFEAIHPNPRAYHMFLIQLLTFLQKLLSVLKVPIRRSLIMSGLMLKIFLQPLHIILHEVYHSNFRVNHLEFL